MSKQNEKDDRPFGAEVLQDTTFRVDWSATKLTKRSSGTGKGVYDAPCILTEVKGYVVPFYVEVTRRDYDALRLMNLQGIKTYTCSFGKVKNERGYFPRIFAGGKDW